jgi:hypothetical protein
LKSIILEKKDKKGKFHEIKDKIILIKVLNHEGQKHQNKDDPFSWTHLKLQDRPKNLIRELKHNCAASDSFLQQVF